MADPLGFRRTLLWSGAAHGFRFATLFATQKLIAVAWGPAGMALFGQFQNLLNAGHALASASVQNGLVQMGANHRESPAALAVIWRQAMRLMLFCWLPVAAAVLLLREPLAVLLFPEVSALPATQVALLLVPLSLLALALHSLVLAWANGLGWLSRWALGTASTGLGQLLLLAASLRCLGPGAFLPTLALVPLLQLLLLVLVLGSARNTLLTWARAPQAGVPVADARRRLYAFAAMGLVPALGLPLALLAIRSRMGALLGWDVAGLWQGVWKISELYTAPLFSVLSVWLLPALSRPQSATDQWRLVRRALPLAAGYAVAGAGALWLLRDWMLPLVLSHEFTGAAELLRYQLLGDLFHMASWCIALLLVARGDLRAMLALEVGGALLLALVSTALMPRFGAEGATLAYLVENIVYLAAALLLALRPGTRGGGAGAAPANPVAEAFP